MKRTLSAAGCALLILTLLGADWPEWGRDGSRNMVAPSVKGRSIPATFHPGEMPDGKDEVLMPKGSPAAKSLRWVAKLGSQSYGNPTIAGGRVFIGTNNASPRDPKYKGDYSMVMAFSDKTGEFLCSSRCQSLGPARSAIGSIWASAHRPRSMETSRTWSAAGARSWPSM